MKLPIIAGFLLAGLGSSKLTQSQMKKVDQYLRSNDKGLSSQYKMEDFKINKKQNAEINYKTQDNHKTKTFEVSQHNGQFNIVGRGSSVQYQQSTVGQNGLLGDIFGSLGLFNNPMMMPPQISHQPSYNPFFMPSIQISQINPIRHTNIFQTPAPLKQLQQKMKNKQNQFQRRMKQGREHMRDSFQNNFQNNQLIMGNPFEPMGMDIIIGSNNNNVWNGQFNGQFNDMNNIQIQPSFLIGGDNHDYWEQKIREQRNQPLIGGGDHDLGLKNGKKCGKKCNKKHTVNHIKQQNHQQSQGLLNDLIKPIQDQIIKSYVNRVLDQGKKLVGQTFTNLKSKFQSVSQQKVQKQKPTLGHLILPDLIEQAIQLPTLLGGQTDSDNPSYLKNKMQKLVQQNSVIDTVLNKVQELMEKNKSIQSIAKQQPKTQIKKVSKIQTQIKDIEQDQYTQVPQKSNKLEVKIK